MSKRFEHCGAGILAAVLVLVLAPPAWGQSPRQLYDYHFEQGNKFQTAMRPREALPHYQAAVEAAKKAGGIERVDRLFYNLGMVQSGCGLYKESLETLEAVETWRRKNLGDDHPETITVIRFLAIFHFGRHNIDKAMEYAHDEVALCERRFGKDATQVADALMSLALCLEFKGQREEQIQAVRRSLAIREAKLGPKNYWLRDPLEMLATLAIQVGEYGEAEALHRRSAGLDPREGGNPATLPAQRANHLAHVADYHRRTGRYLEADAIYREISAIYNKLSEHEPATYQRLAAMNYAVAGDVHLEMGLPDKAMSFYSAACHLHEKAGSDPSVSFALEGMGRCHQLRGELDEAAAFYAQAFETGKGYRGLAILFASVASLLRDQGKYDSSAEFFTKAAEGLAEAHGDKSPYFVRIRLDQAELEVLRGNRAEAEKLYRQVIELGGAKGSSNPDAADAHMGLARLALAAGEAQLAVSHADKARRELRRYTRRLLPAFSEHEQLEFLANREARSFSESLALALALPGDRTAREAAAGWVLNAKGQAQEAVAQRTLLARGTTDPKLASVLREWLAVRYRLAQLSVGGGSKTANSKDRDSEIAALSGREERLAGQLGRSSVQDRADPWVEIRTVREKLPKDAVLIEIVRHEPAVKKRAPTPGAAPAEQAKVEKPAEPARYLAWIIPPAGPREVALVDLGPCEAMDEAVAKARKPLLGAPEQIVELGDAEAEASLKKELAELSKRLLEPLRPHVGDSKHWILSPDGSLWLVPWAALSLEEGKYLVESHVTRFVVSGRDLVEQSGQKASGNAPLVLADPDFDLADKAGADGPGEGTRGAGRLEPDDVRTRATRSAAVRGAVATSWQRLPGTAREAKDLEPKLSAYTASKIELFTGRAAAESIVRDAWQPRVAVLSTHGYYLPRPAKSTESLTLQSPLVRCGLVLAGANRRGQATGAATDDGILTGLEIVGADLRGTELVVLSACETGLGEVRAAEGVVGLRQAFQLAGAQSVLASLWRVPDADTAQLMAGFYDRLATTGDKAVALREAQLALLESHRKATKSGHPYYWAAFTFTGRADRPEVAAAQPRPARVAVRPCVRVVSATAPVMDGAAQIALARQGEVFEVTSEQGEWLLVPVAGRAKPGWILKRHVEGVED